MKTKDDIKVFLIKVAGYDKIEVEDMSDFELFDSYLGWLFGIIGVSEDIIDAVNAIFGVDIEY